MVAVVHVETVLLAESENHLEAVERAKRTGEALESVAAGRSFVVPRDVAQKLLEEAAHDGIYVNDRFGQTYAAHLESYHEKIKDPEFVLETNEEKAKQHAEYSADFVRRRTEEDNEVRAKMVEGFDPTVAIQQANLERAREHEAKSADYERLRVEREKEADSVFAVVDESVRVLNVEELGNAPVEERANALAGVVATPNVNETETKKALEIKDKIIETVLDYKSEVAAPEVVLEDTHPGVPILMSAGSPEELRESTGLAQAYADNRTEEAVKAVAQVEEEVAKRDSEKTANKPGKVLREAEATVEGGRDEADAMPENPKK
jgi:hypothetical protein